MKHDSRLIERPARVPLLERTLWSFVTAAFWIGYLYLLTPAITLVAWLLGLRVAFAELYLRGHHVEPFLLIALPVMALTSATLLILWAELNRRRFTGRERRSFVPSVEHSEVAISLGASDGLSALSHARVVLLEMDDQALPRALHHVPLSDGDFTPRTTAQAGEPRRVEDTEGVSV